MAETISTKWRLVEISSSSGKQTNTFSTDCQHNLLQMLRAELSHCDPKISSIQRLKIGYRASKRSEKWNSLEMEFSTRFIFRREKVNWEKLECLKEIFLLKQTSAEHHSLAIILIKLDGF